MNEKEWIDRLRQSAQDFQEPAPDGLWDSIDKEITPMLSRKKPKIMPLWIRRGGIAAAVALLCGLGSIILLHRDDPQPIILATSEMPANSVKDEKTERESNSPKLKVGNVLAQNKTYPIKPHSIPIVSGVSETVPEIVNDSCGNNTFHDNDSISTPDTDKNVDSNVAENRKAENHNTYIASSDLDIILPKNTKSVTLTAYAGNLMMNGNTTQSGYSPVADGFIPNDGDLTDIPVGSDPAADIVLGNQGEDVETKTSHRLPIRFGVNVSIPVYDKLSVETGITYSILSSTTKSGTKYDLFDTEQTLHYIGIPVSATYDIWNGRNFGVYATGGGMVEKCVYGRSVTDFVIGNEVASSERKKISERQFQFSVMAGIGVKWNITKTVNLFAEPGVSYYINNHSDIINSYKDKPFNFDLKIGLRFNINP